jgi:hypothetical protein
VWFDEDQEEKEEKMVASLKRLILDIEQSRATFLESSILNIERPMKTCIKTF